MRARRRGAVSTRLASARPGQPVRALVPDGKALPDKAWMLRLIDSRNRQIGDVDCRMTAGVAHELAGRNAIFTRAMRLRWRTHLPSLDIQRRREYCPADVTRAVGLQGDQMPEDDAVHGTSGGKVHMREHRFARFIHRRRTSNLDYVGTDRRSRVGFDSNLCCSGRYGIL